MPIKSSSQETVLRTAIGRNFNIKSDGINDPTEYIMYGSNDDYPELFEKLTLNSPSAAPISRAYYKFLKGHGFVDPNIGEIVVGVDKIGKDITMNRLLSSICTDKSIFNGFYVYIYRNVLGQVSEVRFMDFKSTRLGRYDDDGRINYVISRQKRFMQLDYLKKLHLFTSNKDLAFRRIKSYLDDNLSYPGEVYIGYDVERTIYPLAKGDAAEYHMAADAEFAIHKYTELASGLNQKTIVHVSEDADNESDNPSSVYNTVKSLVENPEHKMVVMSTKTDPVTGEILDNGAIKVQTIETNIDSDLYKVIADGTGKSISDQWDNIPKILIDFEATGLGANGEVFIKAIHYYNEQTSDARADISKSLKEIFANSSNEYLRNADFTIKKINPDVYSATNV